MPWLETSSLYSGAHSREHTWDWVSVLLSREPFPLFQILIHLSAVPPPLARMLGCQGHQESALTAAWWCVREWRGLGPPWRPPASGAHSASTLSFPPLASMRPSGLQARPHTSWACPDTRPTWCCAILTSLCWISPALLPEDSR